MKIPSKRPRSRSAMIAYLAEHPRYHTMNSWNGAMSYSQCVKVTHCNLTGGQAEACYAMLAVDDAFLESGFTAALQAFDRRWDYAWQIGHNGRSGGYLVLYQGGREPSGYRSVCGNCGQLNYRTTTETGKSCGGCGEEARRDFPADRPHMRSFCRPGRGVDMDGDLADWGTSELRDRVEVVWDFDRTCSQAVECFVAFAEGHKVEDRTILVPRTIRVAVSA